MKKVMIIIISIILMICLAGGGFALYKINTPEFALVKTIADVKKTGISGLEKHMTKDAFKRAEQMIDWSDDLGILGIFSMLAPNEEISLLKSKISEIDWTVEDVIKGKKKSNVILRFNYHDQITGTIEIAMVREKNEWKINGIEKPSFELEDYSLR